MNDSVASIQRGCCSLEQQRLGHAGPLHGRMLSRTMRSPSHAPCAHVSVHPGLHRPLSHVLHLVLVSVHFLLDLPKEQRVRLLSSDYLRIKAMFPLVYLPCSEPLSPANTSGCTEGMAVCHHWALEMVAMHGTAVSAVSQWDSNSLPRHRSASLFSANMYFITCKIHDSASLFT